MLRASCCMERALSSFGRAPALQAGGDRFEPDRVHISKSKRKNQKSKWFLVFCEGLNFSKNCSLQFWRRRSNSSSIYRFFNLLEKGEKSMDLVNSPCRGCEHVEKCRSCSECTDCRSKAGGRIYELQQKINQYEAGISWGNINSGIIKGRRSPKQGAYPSR